MKNELLHVVAVVSNPIRWDSRIALYRKFEQHMIDSGVKLTVVECQYGDRPFELDDNPEVNHVGVRSNTMVWNKENLINIGISRLPHDWEYVAWIDADITFRKKDWASEVVHALQHYEVVQPWEHCYDLGPNDEHIQTHRSFCYLYRHGKKIMQGPKCGPGTPYEFAHPGYAWACRRSVIEACGGLVEMAALGAGDHHMAMAFIGRVDDTIPNNLSAAYKRCLRVWEKRAVAFVRKNIGYIAGTIEHAFHGAKADRKYVDRWHILAKHDFDPDHDLKKNSHGVVELAGNKPEMRHAIDRYFHQRNEDTNSI